MPIKPHLMLAPLLERRKRLEEEKQQHCALRRRERDDVVCRIDALLDAGRRAMRRQVSVVFLSGLDAAVTHLHARSAAAATRLEQAQRELLAAARERRTIEKLQERRRRAYEYEAARREEAEFDEANARQRRVRR